MRTLCFLLLFTTFFDGFSQSGNVRRNVKTFTQAEINELTSAIVAMKNPARKSLFDNTINAYDYFAKLHWQALNPTSSEMMTYGHYAHGNPGFLTWHREFLRRFELELRVSTGKPNYMIPYWDWTDRSYDAYIFSANFMGSNGSPTSDPTYRYEVLDGPFGRNANAFPIAIQTSYDNPQQPSRQYLQRRFAGSIANTLPTATDVINSLTITSYDVSPWNTKVNENQSFRQFLEGFRYRVNVDGSDTIANELHGRVHIYVAGHLVSDASPNDPLFFMNHANVDRIFALWQDKYGVNNFPQSWTDAEHNLTRSWNDAMYPFSATHRSVLSVRSLGYIYDTQATNIRTVYSAKGVSFNKTGDAPSSSAILDIKHDSLGILIPRLPLLNRPASPATGLLIYQTDNTPGFYYFDGILWQRLNATPATSAPAPASPMTAFALQTGTGRLQNGRAAIKFDQPVEDVKNLLVNIQLEGDCNGVYIARKDQEGFEVRELQNGQSNATFFWKIEAMPPARKRLDNE